MRNGWTEAPTSPYELPWNIRAGKRVLWWIDLEPSGEYPARSFVVIGSLKTYLNLYTIEDGEAMGGGGYYYDSVVAYKEIGKGPHDD